VGIIADGDWERAGDGDVINFLETLSRKELRKQEEPVALPDGGQNLYPVR
jgi:hypothetical protein